MTKEDAWKLFDPYNNDTVIGDSMTVYELNMLKVAFFAGFEAAYQDAQVDKIVCWGCSDSMLVMGCPVHDPQDGCPRR